MKIAHCHHSCEHRVQQKTAMSTIVTITEKVSAVVLCILSAYTALELFIPFFFAGIAISFYNNYSKEHSKESKGHSHSLSCGQGFLENITGVELPPVVRIIANLAITICHIDHHAEVFVPLVAIHMGASLEGYVRAFV